ncbi:hypothetical protein L0991_03720 [Vibrio chagasii]|uniref:hypothetical protein n=1 Tax=Vibrio chagasii TaxID=170679 RepID=UPI0035A6DB83
MLDNVLKEIILQAIPRRHKDHSKVFMLSNESFKRKAKGINFANFDIVLGNTHKFRLTKIDEQYCVNRIFDNYVDDLVITLTEEELTTLRKALDVQ